MQQTIEELLVPWGAIHAGELTGAQVLSEDGMHVEARHFMVKGPCVVGSHLHRTLSIPERGPNPNPNPNHRSKPNLNLTPCGNGLPCRC